MPKLLHGTYLRSKKIISMVGVWVHVTLVTLQEPESLPERLDLHGLSEEGSP